MVKGVVLESGVSAPPMRSWSDPARGWLPEAEALADEAVAVGGRGEPEGLRGLLEGMGAPALDVLVTAMSGRAALLGLSRGCAFAHHELRGRLPMPKGLEPEIAVWGDGTVPVWNDGVLEEPKYFSFFQDAPVPVFNPNHRRKWRAHELLHAAQGFFWNPEMSRFSFYLGARLNELLPVVPWYGFDEAARPRCAAHEGAASDQEFCRGCEAAARPWWEMDAGWRAGQREAAVGCFERGLEHFEAEWSACVRELEGGRRVSTPRPGLDASSDAVGYLRGHWNRVTAWSFGSWVEMFLVDGEDYFSTLEGAMGRAARTARALTGGRLELSSEDFAARRARRVIQDIAGRSLLAMEWLEEGSAAADRVEGALMPALERAADVCGDLMLDPDTADAAEVVAEILGAWKRCAPSLPEVVRKPLGVLGYLWPDMEGSLGLSPSTFAAAATPQLVVGVRGALPLLCDGLEADGEGIDALVGRFAGSAAAQEGGTLGERAARWLKAQSHPRAGLAGVEVILAAAPQLDEEAELFGVLPDSPDDLIDGQGVLRRHATMGPRSRARSSA